MAHPKDPRRRRQKRPSPVRAPGNYNVESLEKRIVLSGTHDAALLAAIDNALQSTNASGLGAWTSKLDDSSALGRSLPLAGAGLGTAYDPGSALKSLLTRL